MYKLNRKTQYCRIDRNWLHTYIYYLPFLEDIGIIITHPLDWANTVIYRCEYTSDLIVYGKKEYWPKSAEEIKQIILTKQEDCDGFASLTASGLYTVAKDSEFVVPVDQIWIAIGWYGDKKDQKHKHHYNHAWCMTGDPNNGIENLFVLETTGDKMIDHLSLLKDETLYTPTIIANANAKYWSI